MSLPPIPPSISVARRIVRDAAGDLPSSVVGDAELLTSELVTNAIRYGGRSIELFAERVDNLLTVAVSDDGAELPSTTETGPAADAVSGRGLRIVEQVARDWGIRTEENRPGKTVWFRVAAEDGQGGPGR
ncbi:MAG: ATP-binding protein [Nocardioides sp.]